MRRYGFLLLFAVLAAFSAPLAAQEAGKDDIELGKEHFTKGVEFFNGGNFEAALAEFMESFRLNPFWAVRYNIAVCYKKTNRFKKSLQEFHAYLDEGGSKISTERKAEVGDLMAEVAKMLGKLRFCCKLGDVEIIVDGKETIDVPEGQETTLDPGLHTIEVQKEGYKSFVSEAVVISGQTKEVKVTLESLISLELQPLKIDQAKAKETPKKKKHQLELRWLWIGLGVGGAVGVGAVVSGVIVLKKKGLMNDEVDKCTVIHSREDCPLAYGYQDEAQKWKIATNVLIGVAALMGATGFILAMAGWSPWKKKKKEKRLSWNVSPFPDAGLSLVLDY